MTQAIAANTMNNLPEVSAKDGGMDRTAEFESIFDKSLTIGDMKNSRLEGLEEVSDFKEILNQASSEVNVENSLDLTLARDITEIITELKNAAEKPEKDEDDVQPAVVADITSFQQILALNTQETGEDISQVSQKSAAELMKPAIKTEEENIEDLESPQEDITAELNIESVEVETETSNDNGSLMNQQSPQEQAVKLMIHNDIDTFEIKQPEAQAQSASKTVSVTPEKIVEQVAKQMESMQGASKVNIVLNPESLGKVSIQLINTKEGLSAQFTVTTNEARDLLMKGLDGLKETLTAHGVGVDNVSIKVNDTQKSEYNSDWTEQEGSRGGNKGQGEPQKEEKEKGLFEKMMSQQTEKE